jgi:hypothetical protein
MEGPEGKKRKDVSGATLITKKNTENLVKVTANYFF